MDGLFDDFFRDQVFGPRNGFEPREFQVNALLDFIAFSKSPKLLDNGRRAAWVFNGGTGAGKTKLAALIASYALNNDSARQIVVVVPNRTIRKKTKADFLKYFGIDLPIFNKTKHRDGIGRLQHGYILTYSALMDDPTLHRRLCQSTKTLVIFDEIHHLGDNPKSVWGANAIEAFDKATHIVGLTGTPYRSDNHPIPFVEYEPTPHHGIMRFVANKTYELGKAVADGHCRKPMFSFHYGEVKIRDSSGKESVVCFDQMDVSEEIGSLRLRGAVAYGSTIRRDMLRQALEQCRLEKRKVIIFLGGDTEGEMKPTADATEFLPSELLDLGYSTADFDVVVGDDKGSLARIDEFHAHPTKWILVSINMISEGTDIPSLSAAIFLTSITAKQTTIQRIGRALRKMEDDLHEDTLIFMFADPDLLTLGREIEKEVKHEINLKKRKEATETGGVGKPKSKAEAIGIGDAPLKVVIFNNKEWPAEVFEQAREKCREKGLPSTYQNAVLILLMKE